MKLASEAIKRQDWEHDRAFIRSLERGKEKGFINMDDFRSKSDKCYAYFASRAVGRRQGERTSRKFALAGAWKRLQPALWIIFFIGMGVWSLKARVFFPDNGQSYLIVKATPTIAVKVPVARSQSPLSDIAGDDKRVIEGSKRASSPLDNPLGSLVGLIQYAAIGTGALVGFVVLSGVFKRKKQGLSIPDTIRVLHEHAPE